MVVSSLPYIQYETFWVAQKSDRVGLEIISVMRACYLVTKLLNCTRAEVMGPVKEA